jgi:TetR/AcrR family acrAB operon transcriptional repressor
MRRTKEDAEKTRQALLQAAELVFGKKGYAATRLSDIADEANVTRGAIYHHFSNKKELFICLNQERVSPYLTMLDHILSSEGAPNQKIARLMKETVQRALKDIRFLTKQRFEFLRDMETNDADSIRDFLKKRTATYRNSVQSLIREGQRTGDIRPDIDSELVVLNIEAYIKGLLAMIMVGDDRKFIKKHTEALVETLLRGL